MARILFVNSVCNGSTGNICKNLYRLAEESGHECCIAFGRGNRPEGFKCVRIGNNIDLYSHVLKARMTDGSGFGSASATRKFVEWIEHYQPDIIHMHNIHGYYLNLEILFEYLKKNPNIKKIWTLHDCWPYTGHCAYYSFSDCGKWRQGCEECPCKNDYPKTFFDNSARNYKIKKKLFTEVKNLVFVTPSEWLKHEIEHSFLKEYYVKVINNGIDTSVFKPTYSKTIENYKIKNKKIILGVASVWDKRKGLDTFIELSECVGEEYQIVLIGLNDKQIRKLPKKIIGIKRTENIQDLATWYSVADIFFNPTLEDNYPTVNLEAQACGTYVVTYDAGGTKETIKNKRGVIVNSVKEMLEVIESRMADTANEINFSEYDWHNCFKEYIDLYNEETSYEKSSIN